MKTEFSKDLIWSLRALAQNANTQRRLYPSFAVVADELVLNFDEAYSNYKETYQTQHADLERLDAHIASKSGVLEVWTDEALDRSTFWSEIRQQAAQALKARDLTTFAPHPSPDIFVTEHEVSISGRCERVSPDDPPASILSRLMKLFR